MIRIIPHGHLRAYSFISQFLVVILFAQMSQHHRLQVVVEQLTQKPPGQLVGQMSPLSQYPPFQKREMLDRLDGIIHPAVKEYIKREVARARKEDVPYFFIEAALLIEEKYDEIYDELWVVYCEPQVRRERLRNDRGYTDQRIDEILANQLSDDEYEAAADFVLYNSEDVEHTHLQIDRRMRKYETM